MSAVMNNALLDSMVSISDFSRIGATKIFDDVNKSGCKIVLKNNSPACVLMSPDRYRTLIDELEDMRVCALASERLANDTETTYSHEDVWGKYNISDEELVDIPMEYGVDFA